MIWHWLRFHKIRRGFREIEHRLNGITVLTERESTGCMVCSCGKQWSWS